MISVCFLCNYLYNCVELLKGKNKISNYLVENTIQAAESYANGTPWTRCIWDVTAVAWLLNDEDRFMLSQIMPCPVPTYDNSYSCCPANYVIRYVYNIKRDNLMDDLFKKLIK